MHKSIIALVLSLSMVTDAFACGGSLMVALYERAFPEMVGVGAAETEARDSAFLTAEPLPEGTLTALHRWRRERTDVTLARLSKRIQNVRLSLASDEPAYLLLINEYQWIELRSGPNGFEIEQRQYAPAQGTPLIFTSRVVLDNLLDRRITFEQAQDNGLIAMRPGKESREVVMSAPFEAALRADAARLNP